MSEKKKMGTGAKVAIGCGSGCLGMVLLVVLLMVGGWIYVKGMIDKYETELKGYGFETVQSGQMMEINEPLTEPVLIKGQMVTIKADCKTDLAVLAQMCEVYGRIEGKLYFRGQMITIHPGAEITGGLDVQAQILQNSGTVSGAITGEYQEIEDGAIATP